MLAGCQKRAAGETEAKRRVRLKPVPKPVTTNFIDSLIAVLAGNAVYFLVMRYLPLAARHAPMRMDLGLVVDFWFCLVVLGIIKTIARYRRASKPRGS